jgi:AAA family ATP:ADP antiporter
MSVTVRFSNQEQGLTLGRGTSSDDKRRTRFRDLIRSPYIIAIFAVYFMSSTTYQLVDFAFYDQAKDRFADADELARFFGLFFGLSQAVTLLLITVVTGRLMGMMGVHVGKVRRFSLAATLLVTIGYAFWGTVPGVFFYLAAITKLTDLVCGRAITAPVFPVLYQVLPRDRRIAVQVSLENIVGPIAGGCVGAALIVLSQFGGTHELLLSISTLVAIGIWHYASSRLNGQYRNALSEALVSRRLEGGSMIYDESTVRILKARLTSSHPGEVIYALDLLDKVADEEAHDFYPELLDHPSPEVQGHVLERIRLERPPGLSARVRSIAIEEQNPMVRSHAIRALCALEESDAVDIVAPYLDHTDEAVRRGAMSGLLRFGGIEGTLAAGQYLLRLENSPLAGDRVFTADVLNDVGITSFYRPLLRLLRDDRHEVRLAALNAASRVRNPRLWPLMIQNLSEAQFSPYAAAALARAGEVALKPMREVLNSDRHPREIKMRAASICGRIAGAAAIIELVAQLDEPDRGIRRAVLTALHHCGYTATGVQVVDVRRMLRQEVADLAWSLSIALDMEGSPACDLVARALKYEMTLTRHRCFLYLSFLYDAKTVLRAEENLAHSRSTQRAYALEALEETISRDLSRLVFPIFEWSRPADCYIALSESFPQVRGSREVRLRELLNESSRWVSPWARASAIHALSELGVADQEIIQAALESPDSVVQGAAILASRRSGNGNTEEKGVGEMLLTIERVLVLKSVTLFDDVPEEVLAALSAEMEEVEVAADVAVYEKGGSGRTMYIIVSGSVKVHDGDRTFVTLGERDFFGELTTLDPAPHSATITAVEDSILLGLDREALYELMSDHPEVLREIIHELCDRLRGKGRD